ncbi:ras family-domain-containing protein [Mycena albidolilacea]|uniref:Ras family-domain-containing protein n=1 Tax=Mycena albidolilacea TaxID=1033008 RepID=A0AAD6ZDR4_9AGAR|nr:ras family-domain-containing protein [Mycena albidolilacea]
MKHKTVLPSDMDQWVLAVLGDGGVGKTALAYQFTLGCFVETYDPTLEDGYCKQFMLDNRMCFVEFTDKGDNEYGQLRDQWVRAGHGFALVYSVVSRSSFDRLDILLQSVRRLKTETAKLILVGNKSDLNANEREVLEEEVSALARQWGCEFFETSAKTGQNVEPTFLVLIRTLRAAKDPASPAKTQQKSKAFRPTCIIL